MTEPLRRRLDIPGQPAGEDQLVGMVLALLSETAVLRERLDTVERLLEQRAILTREDVEAFQPEAAAMTERDAARKRMIDKVLRPVRDALARASGGPS